MSKIVNKKIKVFIHEDLYYINLTMRSFLEYEKLYNAGLLTEIDDVYLGNPQKVLNFLSVTLRYVDKFYKDSEEEMIISEEDFLKLTDTEDKKIKFLLKLSTFVRICIYENMKDEDKEEDKKKKNKKKEDKEKEVDIDFLYYFYTVILNKSDVEFYGATFRKILKMLSIHSELNGADNKKDEDVGNNSGVIVGDVVSLKGLGDTV